MIRPYIAFIALLTASPVIAHDTTTDNTVEEMVEAATIFLASLNDEQRSKATFTPTDNHRESWFFIPDKFIKPGGKRQGLKIKNMTQQQRLLAHALLATVMSNKGYKQSTTIMTLEAILHELENKNPIRDPEIYYVSIFGKPGSKNTWAWRFEGHHLSINVAVAKGKMFSVTPSFFGTNPARVEDGAFQGLEVLSAEQELALTLIKSLNPEQLKLATIAAKAPADIITKQQPRADRKTFLPVQGIAYQKLNPAQQAMLLTLLSHYAAKYRPEVIDEINSRKPIDGGKQLHFAWAGGHERNDGHYYRIQSKDFLFEYDNTQNGANHVHAVWRDFSGDFGRDLLKEHHKENH
jgi:hypothetical protein